MKSLQSPQDRAPAEGAFSIPVRIYYEDTDAGGVVYYANYLKYLERCRTEWLRSLGFDQSELLRDPGVAFVVRSVAVDYLKPARLDDALQVSLEVIEAGRAQIVFRQHIRRIPADSALPTETLISGTIRIVCVNSASMKPCSLPPALRPNLETPQ